MEVEEYQIPIRRGRRQRRRRWRIPPLVLIGLAAALCILIGWNLLNRPAAVPPMEDLNLPDWVTVKLLPLNEWSRPGTPLEAVNGVVVHYVGNPGTTAEQNNSYFQGLAESHLTYASSQFLIGLDGEVLLNVPLDEVAYCSNNRNDDTLSIECCHPGEDGAFTPATYDALVKLVRWLMDTYDLKREDIIRHYDVTGKECPKYFVDHEDVWDAFLDEVDREE